jgi:hypothetical protein
MYNKNYDVEIVEVKKMIDNSVLNLEYPIQRNDEQWNLQTRKELISSILEDSPIPPIYVAVIDGKKNVIDGKQRLSNIRRFLDDEFEIDTDEGSMTFSKLDIKNKEKINKYKLAINEGEYPDSDTVYKMFIRLNSGKSLTASQLYPAYLGKDVANWSNNMLQHDLFTKQAKFTTKQKNDDAMRESLLQGVCMIHGCLGDSYGNIQPFKSISRKEITNYVKNTLSKADNKTLEDFQEAIVFMDGVNINEAIEKTFIPSLIVLTKYAILSEVDKEDYINFLKDLLLNKPDSYRENMGAGNVSRRKTMGRLKALIEEFNRRFPDLKKPLICLTEIDSMEEMTDYNSDSSDDSNNGDSSNDDSTLDDIISQVLSDSSEASEICDNEPASDNGVDSEVQPMTLDETNITVEAVDEGIQEG